MPFFINNSYYRTDLLQETRFQYLFEHFILHLQQFCVFPYKMASFQSQLTGVKPLPNSKILRMMSIGSNIKNLRHQASCKTELEKNPLQFIVFTLLTCKLQSPKKFLDGIPSVYCFWYLMKIEIKCENIFQTLSKYFFTVEGIDKAR
jgi:hypothetical protein